MWVVVPNSNSDYVYDNIDHIKHPKIRALILLLITIIMSMMITIIITLMMIMIMFLKKVVITMVIISSVLFRRSVIIEDIWHMIQFNWFPILGDLNSSKLKPTSFDSICGGKIPNIHDRNKSKKKRYSSISINVGSKIMMPCREHHRWEGSVGFPFWRPLAQFRKPP